jgi:hypothetical protein
MNDELFGASSANAPGAKTDLDVLALEVAHTFESAGGKKVLEYLRSITLARYLPPNATDAELRYLEGQRYLVSFIANMVKKGKRG